SRGLQAARSCWAVTTWLIGTSVARYWGKLALARRVSASPAWKAKTVRAVSPMLFFVITMPLPTGRGDAAGSQHRCPAAERGGVEGLVDPATRRWLRWSATEFPLSDRRFRSLLLRPLATCQMGQPVSTDCKAPRVERPTV